MTDLSIMFIILYNNTIKHNLLVTVDVIQKSLQLFARGLLHVPLTKIKNQMYKNIIRIQQL